MNAVLLRKSAVLIAVALAIVIPAVQAALALGLSQAEFAAQGDSTLRAAGYAFSIWGLIYLALAVYAIWQLRAPDTGGLRALGWPSAIAAGACGLWIVCASANWMAATVAVILVALAAALAGLVRGGAAVQGKERLLALTPIALLAGWLTAAAPLNVLTVLTAMGAIGEAAAPAWAVGAVILVVLVAGAFAWISRVWIYPLPTAWGLVGVHVAERADKPDIALAAAGAAGLLLVVAALVALLRRR